MTLRNISDNPLTDEAILNKPYREILLYLSYKIDENKLRR